MRRQQWRRRRRMRWWWRRRRRRRRRWVLIFPFACCSFVVLSHRSTPRESTCVRYCADACSCSSRLNQRARRETTACKRLRRRRGLQVGKRRNHGCYCRLVGLFGAPLDSRSTSCVCSSPFAASKSAFRSRGVRNVDEELASTEAAPFQSVEIQSRMLCTSPANGNRGSCRLPRQRCSVFSIAFFVSFCFFVS
ncbi:hypothetical protein BKA81DRAFT_234161 [Phyllosticta paracitricarpa]|uniref:Secreted protein n=1 Tax=Phyllosticta paracitricarpa TaxID=2016321 RepID=A0ABR1MRV2_9PEZI